MFLPKSLTTVTPFSKYLALSLFIVLPLITFYIGSKYASVPVKKSALLTLPSPAPTPKAILDIDTSLLDKTYSTSKDLVDIIGGFSFRYPSDWIVEESGTNEQNTILKIYDPNIITLMHNASEAAKEQFMITISKWNKTVPSIYSLMAELVPLNDIPVKLNQDAKEYDAMYVFNPELSAYIPNQNGNVTVIKAGKYLPQKQIFDSLLSTFRFIEMKTYTNKEFGFQITYPKHGTILDSNGTHVGECGNAIKKDQLPTPPKTVMIAVDNFFLIYINDWNQPLSTYLALIDPGNHYDTEPIAGSGADEAIKVNGLRQGIGSQVTEGFGYTYAIYKKNNRLFTLSALQNPDNIGGCVSSNDWIPGSIKFTN